MFDGSKSLRMASCAERSGCWGTRLVGWESEAEGLPVFPENFSPTIKVQDWVVKILNKPLVLDKLVPGG